MGYQLCDGEIISLPVTSLKYMNPEAIDSSHNVGIYSPDRIGVLTTTIGKHITCFSILLWIRLTALKPEIWISRTVF